MAELRESPAAEGPQVPPSNGQKEQIIYLSGLPRPDGKTDAHLFNTHPSPYSVAQLRVDPLNPNRATAVVAPGADEGLIRDYRHTVEVLFNTKTLPEPGQKFIHVEKPAVFERDGESWKMVSLGEASYSNKPQVRQAEAPAPAQVQVPYGFGPALEVAQQAQKDFSVKWTQINDEAAPLEAIARYLSKENITLAEPISVKRGGFDKLTSELGFKYDPAQVSAEKVEGIIAGLNKVGAGSGLRVFERKEYSDARIASVKDVGETITVRNAFAREIETAREWPQDSKSLEVFIRPDAPQVAEAQPASAPAQSGSVLVPEQAPTEPKAAASLGLDANPAPIASATVVPATPAAAKEAQPGVGEVQITWKQKGNEVAPLTEMRAYFDSLKEQGVAVGAMKFGPDKDGKLTGSFGVSYDPNAPDLTKLEGTIQGLKKVGGGLDVLEAPEQAVARRRGLGYEGQDKALDLAFPIKEAFGVRQWDSLSAQFSAAPKQALTGPEQAQQAAGIERVGQIARQQGKTSEQVVQDGKSLLEIDTSGNPVSAFLKNFYDHLNGAPKTRQHLEVDYEKTRQELQARLTAKAGNALAAAAPSEAVAQVPAVTPATATAPPAATPAPAVATPAAPAAQAPALLKVEPLFKESELPKDKLALFGLSIASLRESGQLQKLVNGEKTDLLTMQGGAQRDKALVPFEGKVMLHREANGSVTLNVELPKQKLVIPNEVGGQPFTPEQRQNLEAQGTVGLVRGLKDAAGNSYNGYVGVDKLMNTIVILPENKVTIRDEIAGVKLSPEQSKDLREGHLVHLPNMRRPDGGKPFDGTVQIHAAKAGVEVRPEPYEQKKQNQQELTQPQPVATERTEKPGQKPAVETVQVQRQEVAPKPVEKVQEEPAPQRSRGVRR